MTLPRISQSPTDDRFVQNPYPFYDRARALGPLVWWDDYALPCTTTFEATNAVLRDRRFGRAPLTPVMVPDHLRHFYAIEDNSMLELETPRHPRLRGLVLRAFTSRRIAGLEPEIRALADEMIGGFPKDDFDLIAAFCAPLPVRIIARLLGVPEDMAPQLLAWSNAMVAMYQARRTRAIEDAADAAARDFATFLRGYVEERRAAPADDLITHLIAAEEDGARLSTDELIATCVLLLNAGHEATVHTLGNGVAALLSDGEAAHWCAPDRAEATVEEVLRHDPPLHMFTRYAYEDMELFGQSIRRGEQVACLLAAAGRDPAVNADPGRFDPARGSPKHLAFGAGAHFCVGAPLARLEMRVALEVLFARCPELRLAEPPRYADLYHFHGLERLMVRTS